MRAKTVKRLAIMMAVVVLVVGSSYFLWRFQVRNMSQGIVAQGDVAEEKGEYANAVDLYQQHLLVFPDDQTVQLKYADTLLKKMGKSPTAKQQEEVLAIYNELLRRSVTRDDVRRKAADLAIKIGGARNFEMARGYLLNLEKVAPNDGEIEFLLGRCYEEEKEAEKAAGYYEKAIAHGAPDRLDASRRLAALLHSPLKRQEPVDLVIEALVQAASFGWASSPISSEADRVIEAMVAAAPKDYRVYLERGRYRRQNMLMGAEDDFNKALELAPKDPEIYLEAAQLAESTTGGLAASRQILDKGLAAAPGSVKLYQALYTLERRSGRFDEAIKTLEDGVKAVNGDIGLRFQLAQALAAKGETGKLQLQIQELKNVGIIPVYLNYFNAYYCVNSHEYAKARQILSSLQAEVARMPDLKALVNVLLARCYGQLREQELQWDAIQRAVVANPNDLPARLEWIGGIARRGDIDGAIREYRRLLDQGVRVHAALVRLMLIRNRQRPLNARDLRQVDVLLDEAEKDASRTATGSPDAMVLRAIAYADQDQEAKARDTLATARVKYPNAVEPWIADVNLLVRRKKFDEATGLLDLARKQLGDRIEFRLARVTAAVARGGPQALEILNDMSKNIESFPKDQRRSLLASLAGEMGRLEDRQGAARMWSQLADQDPQDLDARLHLFDLSIQAADRAQAEKQIEAIDRIDGSYARFCRAEYLIWQAGRPGVNKVEKERLRTDARALLADLRTRRSDWSLIPLVSAKLEEQELAQEGLTEKQKQEKLEALIISYRRAIDLGSRDTAVVRRLVYLLTASGRGSDAIQLFTQIPATSQLGGEMERMMLRAAVQNEDYRQAEEIARKAVAAKPNDFQERIWLANILLATKRPDDAEEQLRQAVALGKDDPNRWRTLVAYLVQSRQLDKAEAAIRDAEANLAQAPLALADCCERLGRAVQATDGIPGSKKWYDRARQWFDKALETRKDPQDLSVLKPLVQFLINTDQIAEAEKQLEAIRTGGKDPATIAWARRSLALVYASGNSRRADKALALLEAPRPRGTAEDPEDMRVLVKVLLALGDAGRRKQAIEVLESMVTQNLASLEDRHLLARLEEAFGDWSKARDHYRDLIMRTNNIESLEVRATYLTDFADKLIVHHKAGGSKDLDEAQEMIDKLKQLQPTNPMLPLSLEVFLDVARSHPEAAEDKIREQVKRNLNPLDQAQLARLAQLARIAESIKQPELAREIYVQIASGPSPIVYKGLLAQFLARRGKAKDAVNYCESLMKNDRDREAVLRISLDIFTPNTALTPEIKGQLNRVIAWFEAAHKANPQHAFYRMSLGNLYERVGDDAKAEEQYRAIVNGDDRDGIASNNLAWLMALREDGKWNDALELINHAIKVRGPNPDFLDTRGVVFISGGQNARAIDDLKQAINVQPTASKYFHLARAYLKLNDTEKAKESLKLAKTKGLPNGLHRLELAAYKDIINRLGMP